MCTTMFRQALIALVALWAVAAPAQSWSGPDSGAPTSVNAMLPFTQLLAIARRAAGGGTHIGSDFDQRAGVYQFKFIKDGVVTLVYVDGRSGQVLGVERG